MLLAIKDWKLREIARENHGGYLENFIGVERETEKAMLVRLEWAYTSNLSKRISVWIPKTAFKTEEDFEAEKKAFEDGCAKYEKLVEFAKANIKGIRKGMKTVTIMKKLAEAGINYEG